MKVCSFLPAATNMIYEMGLERHLNGVTFECPSDKPKVVRTQLEGKTYSSAEIETIFTESSNMGKSLYYVDMELLTAIEPDLVFTQDVCDVCQISTSVVQRAIGSLKKQPKVVPLIPRRLRDVYQNALTIAMELGEEKVGLDYLAELQKRVRAITDKLREHQVEPKRVMIMEWLDPIYNCGHWIPDQIALAGGVDMLSNPAGYSVVTPWEKVQQYDPEVLVIAPCGFQVGRSIQELGQLTNKPGWSDLTAVKNRAVYLADADYFTRPSTTLVDGIEILAALFHPHLFEIPETSKKKVLPVTEKEIIV
ncbi:ABC transporter substrate-binding protein [Bacillus sp. FJAT-29790]|uniref:ABC transporter substrate-binding protein n=1 Tax=Bacillus sp. FJAT-29790 TaxID=1895002 RepID=UPI001C22DFB4|nr:ABC transporter substrate-binding protein [Bacillus sp. FJAT-29790]MBU8877386.1 ABC transporter substrate-binding protein [Bacillus sp. FJAT-29790]